MLRKRLVATILALGTSTAAVIAADPPPPPAPVTVTEQPPNHIIKVEIGFDPTPLEEPTISALTAPEPTTPASAVPVQAPVVLPPSSAPPAVVPPTPTVAPLVPAVAPAMPPFPPLEAPKANALTLSKLERMALTRMMAKAQPKSGSGSAIQQCSCTDTTVAMTDATVELPQGFIDQVIAATTKPGISAQPQVLAQEYRMLNNVRLRYYHLLALQRLIAVREELAGISRDAVSAIEAMAAAGQATKAELLQARVEAREQLSALQYAKSVHQAVWQRMAASVGQPDLPVAPLAGDLEKCCAPIAFDAAWAHLLEASPELLAVHGEVAMRQAALRSSLSSNCKSCSGEKSGSDGLISQAVNSFISGPFVTHEQSVKPAAWAELSRCEQEVSRVEQSLRQRLTDACRCHDRANAMAEVYRNQNLPEAKEAFELSVIAYRQGRGSWPQVQITQRNFFRMSTEYVEALAELRRTELVILGLVMDVPDETQPVVKPAAYRQ
jgi:cobalt-zinc-cadmium efflux system outer membrane protein